METGIWKTRDGREIKIADMDNRHLINTIKMLNRNGFISCETFKFYICCTPPSGDGANDLFNQELDAVLERKPIHVLDELTEELERRGLDI